MRWLEGWFGTASGVVGALAIAIMALLSPAYASSESCISVDGGPPSCSYSQPNPQLGPLILIAVLFVLFVLTVVGTWLDLSGRRTVGRLILLISITLLMPLWLSGVAVAHGGFPLLLTYPFALMAFVAGILACVRRDAPRVAVAPAMPAPAPTMMQPPAAPPSAPPQN